MAEAKLSSEDEEIENPIETAVSRGATLVEHQNPSISLISTHSGQQGSQRFRLFPEYCEPYIYISQHPRSERQ